MTPTQNINGLYAQLSTMQLDPQHDNIKAKRQCLEW